MVGLPSDFSTTFDILFPSSSTPSVNPYSARNLRGVMRPCEMASGIDKLARTINGGLVDISAPQMRKYSLEISGEDMAPPAFDRLWVGQHVVVNAMVELAFLTAGGSPERTPVTGSVSYDGDFTYYQPQFQMLVVSREIERQEWAAVVRWSLVLEEI